MSTTTNIGLAKFVQGSSGWSAPMNHNLDLIDSAIGTLSGGQAGLALVATTGLYSDLLGAPTLVSAFLNDKNYLIPSSIVPVGNVSGLATVATSGSYTDLISKPIIPAAQVQTDWNGTVGLGVLLNKPTLATVAISGSYTDLSNKPTIPFAQVQTDWNATVGLGVLLNKPVFAASALIDTTNASNITTGVLPHAQLPTLLSADIPNNSANTLGTAAGLSANVAESQVTNLVADLDLKAPLASPAFTGRVGIGITPTQTLDMKAGGTYGYNGIPIIQGNVAAQSWFFGGSAGNQTTTGTWNTAVGNLALAGVTTGGQNNAFGRSAGMNISAGVSNNAQGNKSLWQLTTGSDNTGIGANTMYNQQTGSGNTAVGSNALGYAVALWSGSYNTAIGFTSLTSTTGSGNIAIGNCSGKYETGSNAFYLNNTDQVGSLTEKAYSLLYGQFAGVAGSLVGQQLTINGKVGIGTAAPKSPLHVVGLAVYANNAAAIAGGLTAGAFYRTGGDPDLLCAVH